MQKKEHNKWTLTVWLVSAFGAVIMMLCQGCASIYMVSQHNKAVRIQAENNKVMVGVDLLNLQGYWATWKADPVGMTGATVLDIGTGFGLGKIVEHNGWLEGGSKETEIKETETLPPVNDLNGDVIVINVGSGTVVVENNGAE